VGGIPLVVGVTYVTLCFAMVECMARHHWIPQVRYVHGGCTLQEAPSSLLVHSSDSLLRLFVGCKFLDAAEALDSYRVAAKMWARAPLLKHDGIGWGELKLFCPGGKRYCVTGYRALGVGLSSSQSGGLRVYIGPWIIP
jgi:hypothetical protein